MMNYRSIILTFVCLWVGGVAANSRTRVSREALAGVNDVLIHNLIENLSQEFRVAGVGPGAPILGPDNYEHNFVYWNKVPGEQRYAAVGTIDNPPSLRDMKPLPDFVRDDDGDALPGPALLKQVNNRTVVCLLLSEGPVLAPNSQVSIHMFRSGKTIYVRTNKKGEFGPQKGKRRGLRGGRKTVFGASLDQNVTDQDIVSGRVVLKRDISKRMSGHRTSR